MKHINKVAALVVLAISFIQPVAASAQTTCQLPKVDRQIGSRGVDVKCLQEFLINKGALMAGYNTGYFGNLTKTALGKFQATNSIAPSAGYWGPKTRAFVSGMTITAVSSPAIATPIATVNATTNLLVSKAAGNPTGSAIAGAGQITVGKYAFTAPSTMGVTITGLTFQKGGVVSNSNLNNMYLANGSTGEIVAQYQSISTAGVVTFSNLNLMVNANQTWIGELRADISGSATAGNTLQFDLTGVTTAGTVMTAGLPVMGNALSVTTVSNPSIATLTMTANAVGSTIDAGTVSALVSSWTSNVTNSAVDLKNLQFAFVGSANASHISNLRLMVNGVQVASLPMASTETVFNLATPVRLNTGNSTIQIFADVLGSPNRTFTFSLLQPYRVNAVDTQYGAGITATIVTTSQTTITINTGSITLQTASNSPTNAVPGGASGVTLGKFSFYAAGEAVKIKFIDVTLTQRTSPTEDWTTTATTFTDDFSNLRVTDDAGGQMGNTISTLASGTSTGQCTVSSTVLLTCHFGTSGSPINYTVPANTTRTLSIVADLGASTDLDTIAAGFAAGTDNMEGQTSFVSTLDSGAATGATRTVTSSSLTPAINSGFSAPTVISSATGAKLASFIITAASAQGATLYSVTIDKDTNTNIDLQNVMVKVKKGATETQFGTTWNTLDDTGSTLSQTFSVSNPIIIDAGSSVEVNVYGDVLSTSSANTYSALIDLTGWSAQGSISGSSITMSPTSVDGQNVTVSSGPTLTIVADSSTPSAKQVVMGTTGVQLYKVRFTASNADDVRITDLVITGRQTNSSSTQASFKNFSLWDGTTCVAGCNGNGLPEVVGTVLDGAATSTVTFSLNPVVVVPRNNGKTLTVMADVATFTDGAVTNSAHTFYIPQAVSANVTARSANSSTATVTLVGGSVASMSGNVQTVFRTKLTLSGAKVYPGTSATNRNRAQNDNLAQVTFNNIGSDQLTISTVILQFSGLALGGDSSATGLPSFAVELLKDDNTALGSASSQSCAPNETNTCIVTFSPAFILSGNQSQVATIRVNSTNFYNTTSTAQTEGLSVFLSATTSVLWNDGTTGSLPLEASVVPFTILDATYN